jgi:hypothetical protein
MKNEKRTWSGLLGTSAALLGLLLVGQPMWTGTFDSPSGSPPFGFAYSSDASGQQFTGAFSVIFSDFRQDGTASAFDLIMRLRKGNDLHNFYFADDCIANACGICQPDGRFSVTLVSFLQQCVETQLGGQVKQAFGLSPTLNVRLKSTSNYRGEPAPSDPSLFLVVSDVELSAK